MNLDSFLVKSKTLIINGTLKTSVKEYLRKQDYLKDFKGSFN